MSGFMGVHQVQEIYLEVTKFSACLLLVTWQPAYFLSSFGFRGTCQRINQALPYPEYLLKIPYFWFETLRECLIRSYNLLSFTATLFERLIPTLMNSMNLSLPHSWGVIIEWCQPQKYAIAHPNWEIVTTQLVT